MPIGLRGALRASRASYAGDGRPVPWIEYGVGGGLGSAESRPPRVRMNVVRGAGIFGSRRRLPSIDGSPLLPDNTPLSGVIWKPENHLLG